MADLPSVTPVTPQQFDIGKGLSNISSILGIRQQEQNLVTNQARQQSAQAEAQKDQQAMGERQFFQQMMQSGIDDQGNSIRNDQGEPDPTKLAGAVGRRMTLTGQPILQSIIKTTSDKVGLQSASASLESQNRENLAGITRSMIGTNAPSDAYDAAIDNYTKDHPEAGKAGAYAKELAQHIDNIPDATAKAKAWSHLADMYSPQAGQKNLPKQAVTGAGTVNVDQATGAISATPGAAPGSPLNPTPPQVSGATARAAGTAGIDLERAKQVGDAQQGAATQIQTSKRVDQLFDAINSGTLAKKISETGNWLGFSSVNQARSELNKDLGQLRGVVADRAGSDTRAGTILEAYPTDTSPAQTGHVAMDYIRGVARQMSARGDLLDKYQKTDPEALRGFTAADNLLTRTSNPLMHEFMSLSPAERTGFYKRNFTTAQEAQEFKDQVTAFQKHTNVSK